jgi:hypothetical protein
MPNVTTQYRMFVPRRRRIGGGGSMIDLVPSWSNAVSGDAHGSAPDTIEVHYPDAMAPAHDANFAFWSIIGSSDGEYTDRPGTPGNAITVHTDTAAVTMTAWYVYAGGGNGPPGPPELETDAFLVDQNTFVEPTPIQSVTPPDAWDHTDVSEFVFTEHESSDVFALDSVVDPAEHFEKWYALEGGSVPAGQTLQVPQGDNGIAIATYRIPPVTQPPKLGGIDEGIVGIVVGGVSFDGGGGIIVNGHYHPVPPWSPFLAAMAVYESATALPRESRSRIQTEALRAIVHAAQTMEKQVQTQATHAKAAR